MMETKIIKSENETTADTLKSAVHKNRLWIWFHSEHSLWLIIIIISTDECVFKFSKTRRHGVRQL